MSDKNAFFEGVTKISDNVYGTIASLKALEVKGVASMSTTAGDDFANLIGMKSQWEGVSLQRTSDNSSLRLSYSRCGFARSGTCKNRHRNIDRHTCRGC